MTSLEQNPSDKVRLYTSRWCAHSMSVEAFLSRYEIPVDKINIDRDPEARDELIELNGGYASVPTLLFADGTKMTEPSFGQLRHKLGLKPPPGLMKRLRDALGRDDGQTEI